MVRKKLILWALVLLILGNLLQIGRSDAFFLESLVFASEDSAVLPTDFPNASDEIPLPTEHPDPSEPPVVSGQPNPINIPEAPELTEGAAAEKPMFYVEFLFFQGRPAICGYLKDITPDMELQEIELFYSLDGVTYFSTGIVWKESDFLDVSEIQEMIAYSYEEPLQSFLSSKSDIFYIRPHVITASKEYDLDAFQTVRPDKVQPLPENLKAYSLYPASMRGRFGVGQYCVTVHENATAAEVYSLLPDTLPIEIQLIQNELELIYSTVIDCHIEWKLPETMPQGGGIIKDVVASLTPLNDIVFDLWTAFYRIEELPEMSMPLQLIVNTVTDEEGLDIELYTYNEINFPEPLSLIFQSKPSGAKKIMLFYSIDGGNNWIELGDILPQNPAIDHFPKEAFYKMYHGVGVDETPFKEYLAGENKGFMVKICIEGGVYDGQHKKKPWPSDYIYVPPVGSNDGNGSGGNENNSGSNNDGENGDGSGNGGVHPDVPEEDIPPLTTPPAITETPKPTLPELTETPKPTLPELTETPKPTLPELTETPKPTLPELTEIQEKPDQDNEIQDEIEQGKDTSFVEQENAKETLNNLDGKEEENKLVDKLPKESEQGKLFSNPVTKPDNIVPQELQDETKISEQKQDTSEVTGGQKPSNQDGSKEAANDISDQPEKQDLLVAEQQDHKTEPQLPDSNKNSGLTSETIIILLIIGIIIVIYITKVKNNNK